MPQEKIVVVEENGPGCFGQGIAMLGVVASALLLLNHCGVVEFIPTTFR